MLWCFNLRIPASHTSSAIYKSSLLNIDDNDNANEETQPSSFRRQISRDIKVGRPQQLRNLRS